MQLVHCAIWQQQAAPGSFLKTVSSTASLSDSLPGGRVGSGRKLSITNGSYRLHYTDLSDTELIVDGSSGAR